MRIAWILTLAGCSGTPVVGVIPVEHNRLAAIIAVTEKHPVHAEGRCVSDSGEVRLLPRQGPDALLDLPLAGLRAESTWTCTVEVDDGKRVRTHEVEVEVGSLPSGLGGWTVEGSTDPAGLTLVNEWENERGHPNMRTVLLDPEGRVRWYRFTDHNVIAGLDGTVTGGGLVLTGGGPDQPPTWYSSLGDIALQLGEPPIPGAYHHHVEPVDDGGVVVLTTTANTRADGSPFTGFGVVWFGPSGAPEWIWDSQQAVDAGTLVPSAIPDPFHANSVSLVDDALGPAAWVSLYTPSTVVRIDRNTGEITHTLGPGGDFALQDPAGAALPPSAWFSGQHDPEIVWPTMLMYDNGLDGQQSRILELDLDLGALTATTTWEWTEPGWFEPLFGDADRLPDDRTLLAKGRCWTACEGLAADRRSEVLEVGRDGSVSWRLTPPDADRGLYRAERVDPCLLWDDPAICE